MKRDKKLGEVLANNKNDNYLRREENKWLF